MPTSFNVLHLGTGPQIDPTEGNEISENAAALAGLTFGGTSDPLKDHIHVLSPGSAGFSGGTNWAYDTDNTLSNDQFRIDGGPNQTYDALATYNATLTYTDGTTAGITAFVMQDTGGNLYMVSQWGPNPSQDAMEAKPIRALTLNSVATDDNIMTGDRIETNYAVCFTAGTAITTPRGPVLIDDLRAGDLVTTMDSGPQAIRWIGRKQLDVRALNETPCLRPIRIRKGLLGAERDLLVSPQHGLLLGRDHLVRARHLAEAPRSRVRVALGRASVDYVHLMFDSHQVIFAETVACESFYPGPMAQRMLDPAALAVLRGMFPALCPRHASPAGVRRHYGGTARVFLRRREVAAQLGCCAHAPVPV